MIIPPPEDGPAVEMSEAEASAADDATRRAANAASSPPPSSHGTSDEDFQSWIAAQLQKDPLSEEYPAIFAKAPAVITRWRRRYRGNVAVWKRIFDRDRIVKEFVEAVPVIDAVCRMVEYSVRTTEEAGAAAADGEGRQDGTAPPKKQFTIIDLASGKGYLSMVLSEMLPPDRVFRIVLMDKAWPMRNSQPTPSHINWEHIYGRIDTGDGSSRSDNHGEAPAICLDTTEPSTEGTVQPGSPAPPATYYETWPIALDTSKQDLKHSRQLLKIREHYLSNPDHPVILLAIHLCGTLSLRAVQLFNDNPDTVHFLALKPCCLPGMVHAKRHEVFHLGGHSFPAEDVCIHGRWKKNAWRGGPPRRHIERRFQRWAGHLYSGILDGDGDGGGGTTEEKEEEGGHHGREEGSSDVRVASAGSGCPASPSRRQIRKIHARVMVQRGGGFQNDFLFAERCPVTPEIWNELEKRQVETDDVPATDNVPATEGGEFRKEE